MENKPIDVYRDLFQILQGRLQVCRVICFPVTHGTLLHGSLRQIETTDECANIKIFFLAIVNTNNVPTYIKLLTGFIYHCSLQCKGMHASMQRRTFKIVKDTIIIGCLQRRHFVQQNMMEAAVLLYFLRSALTILPSCLCFVFAKIEPERERVFEMCNSHHAMMYKNGVAAIAYHGYVI